MKQKTHVAYIISTIKQKTSVAYIISTMKQKTYVAYIISTTKSVMQGSLLVYFHPCLAPVSLTGTSVHVILTPDDF